MVLSDRTIKELIASGRLRIEPFDALAIQPSSVDLRLDNRFRVFRSTRHTHIDPRQEQRDLTELVTIGDAESFVLQPGQFCLGNTWELVSLPDDVVGRLEGKSSLGRLGLVIHSSLPHDAPVLFLDEDGVLGYRPIGEVVEQRSRGRVVSFDPETFKVGFHQVTGWFRELPDKIYEVRLASGRRVRVTAGHNLFTVGERGDLVKTPTGMLRRGVRVAIPRHIPDPASDPPEYRTLDLLPGSVRDRLTCHGPTIDALIEERTHEVRGLLAGARLSARYWLRARKLPLVLAQRLVGAPSLLVAEDRIAYAGSRASLPAVLRVDEELAWLLGMYIAEGSRRARQVVISNTDQRLLDRAEAVFVALGQRVYRGPGSVTCLSTLLPYLFRALGMGDGASSKRLPSGALGWPRPLLATLLRGMLDGDGSARQGGEVLWTTSSGLVHDTLYLAARLGQRATSQARQPRAGCQPLHAVSLATNEHKMLTAVPLPNVLLKEMRSLAGLSQVRASFLLGYKHPTSLNNVERRQARDAVRLVTLRRMRNAYELAIPKHEHRMISEKLSRLVDGDLLWDEVVAVVDTGRFETVYDLEVRPDGAHIENFLAGHGGVFVSNTAGYVDPGFRGHLTLELSNAASLPIKLYPKMKIGQLSFLKMTTPADRPYGSQPLGSKYQGQTEPTASRVHLDFPDRK